MSATSKAMARKFAKDTRVVATDGTPDIVTGFRRFGTVEGTVQRFRESPNAQGGEVTVLWDTGFTGRKSPGSLATVEEAEAEQRAAQDAQHSWDNRGRCGHCGAQR